MHCLRDVYEKEASSDRQRVLCEYVCVCLPADAWQVTGELADESKAEQQKVVEQKPTGQPKKHHNANYVRLPDGE